MGKIINLHDEDDFVICEGCEKVVSVDNARVDMNEGVWFCNPCIEEMSKPCTCENPIIHMEDEWQYCEDCGQQIK